MVQIHLRCLERSYLVILEQFDPVEPDEMDRVFDAVSATTCQLGGSQ